MNKPLRERDLEQAIEAQARGEQAQETPAERDVPQRSQLDRRRSKMPQFGSAAQGS